jgi:glutaredoxin-dependent peroxiredoxin
VAPRLGQKVPEFVLPDADNKLRSLDEFTEQGTVVLAFFPLAFSGTCDREMCAFRDGLGALLAFKARVVGISVDSTFSLKAFAQTYNLQFPLLSDFNKKVSKLFGVLQDPWVGLGYRGVAKRSVFVVDGRGILRYRWVTDSPSDEPSYQEVVRVAEKLSLQPSIFIRAKR